MQAEMARGPEPRKRLAIVSSWNENCGNASYTFALKKEFEKHYDVEVLPLDLFILQKPSGLFRRLGDRHISELANRLKGFDYVNIQFEAGLYGATIPSMRRRILQLIDAAPNLILTMHRLDMDSESLLKGFVASLRSRSIAPFRQVQLTKKFSALYRAVVERCREGAKTKNVWIKVHTKRERRLIKEAFGFENCVDFPLAFLSETERDRVMEDVRRDTVLQRFGLPENAKTIGAFGYVSNYKGFETLVRAISILPPEWHLLIVGSQHPQSVRPWAEIDPYLHKLVHEIEDGSVGHKLKKRVLELEDGSVGHKAKFAGDATSLGATRGANSTSEDDAPVPLLHERVRFVGNVSDDDFTFLLRNTDAVVLPYLEVGQSMSGVVALALESGARLFCSNALSFSEARRFYGNVFTSFDIGNYFEVAQKVQNDSVSYDEAREEVYGKYNIKKSIDIQRDLFERRTHCS
jgi:glycosyltransferase involved in cell wall biosynthesis